MPIPTSIDDLSLIPANNWPAGSDAPDIIDETFREHAAYIAKLREDRKASVGMRNLIINGNFSINQRNYVSGSAVGAANTYTLDRWRVVVSGQSITFTASGNGNLVTAPAGGIEQVIEGASIAGGTYCINWTGTATCTVNGTARAKGATFTLTANTNATLRFSGGTVGEVQVEPGTVVTAFEARPVGLERMLCKRYFEAGEFQISGYSSFGTSATLGFSVEKRAIPTIVISAINYNGLGATGAAISSSAATGFIGAADWGGTPAYRYVSFNWAASAEL